MISKSHSFRAQWVIPVERPAIHNGIVTVTDGIISEVAPAKPHVSIPNLIDLGSAAIIPGLVNAHTHLEFSHLDRPLGHDGIEFTDWIREIVNTRNQTNQTIDDKTVGIQRGMLESFQAGVWSLGEIATDPVAAGDYDFQQLDAGAPTTGIDQVGKVIFYERLGRVEQQFETKLNHVEIFLKSPIDSVVLPGISPHAPYSTHPQLVQQICEMARSRQFPVAMHLAETEAERELLEHRSGPFVELLRDFGVWDESSFLPTTTILHFLELLSEAPRSLVIHGNYLDTTEIDLIAKHRGRMSVVYCPRTHRYFRHQQYPLERLLNAGINVAIGTDSRASNPDLNLFEELKAVSTTFPHLSWQEILAMGTINGANALGLDADFGSLVPGKRAALTMVDLPNGKTPPTCLFDESSRSTPLVVPR